MSDARIKLSDGLLRLAHEAWSVRQRATGDVTDAISTLIDERIAACGACGHVTKHLGACTMLKGHAGPHGGRVTRMEQDDEPQPPVKPETFEDKMRDAPERHQAGMAHELCLSMASFITENDAKSVDVAAYLEQRLGPILLRPQNRALLDPVGKDARQLVGWKKPDEVKPETSVAPERVTLYASHAGLGLWTERAPLTSPVDYVLASKLAAAEEESRIAKAWGNECSDDRADLERAHHRIAELEAQLAPTANQCDEDGVLWETRHEETEELRRREASARDDAEKRIAELEAQLAASAVEISEMVASHAAAVAQIRRIEQDRALVLDRLAASERALATARADALTEAYLVVNKCTKLGQVAVSLESMVNDAKIDAARAKAVPSPATGADDDVDVSPKGCEECDGYRHGKANPMRNGGWCPACCNSDGTPKAGLSPAPESTDAAALRSRLFELAAAWRASPDAWAAGATFTTLVGEIDRLRAIRDAAKGEAK